jgi:hypothetical protein
VNHSTAIGNLKPDSTGENTPLSARTPFKSKNAATQIKLAFVVGHAALKGGHDPAMDVLAALQGLNNSSLAQNAKMLGDVVLGNSQAFGQFAHIDGTGKQFLHDPPSRLVPQSLEKWCAAFRVWRRHTP